MNTADKAGQGRNRDLAAYAALIFVGFLSYFNSLLNPFIWDDIVLIVNNLHIRDIGYIPRFFLESVYYSDATSTFYRPVLMASFSLDFHMWELEAFGYHLTNIYLHICTALLIYAIVRKLFEKSSLAFLAAALFVVHPVHTEAVTYIAGRADPLSAFLCLLSLAFYVEYCSGGARRSANYAASVFFFLLAAFTKESSLWFPAFLVLYRIYFTEGKRAKALLREMAPFAVIIASYLAVRVLAVGVPLGDKGMSDHIPLSYRMVTAPLIIIEYIKMLLWPAGLHMERVRVAYDYLYVLADPALLASVIAVITFSAAAFMLRRRSKPVSFGMLWFGIGLFPFLNIVPLNATVAEHWLYFPSIGFFIVAAAVLYRMAGMRSIRLAIISFSAVIIMMLSALTINQNYIWRDPLYFFRYTLEFSPWSSRLHSNLGVEYSSRGMIKESEEEYKKAIELAGPGALSTMCNLASLYYYSGREDDAIKVYLQSIALDDKAVAPHMCLGNIYMVKGDFDKAVLYYGKAAELGPEDAVLWDKYGDALLEKKEYDKAIAAYGKALEIYPYMIESRVNAGIAYEKKGEFAAALREYGAALEMSPDNPDICERAGKLCEKMGAAKQAKYFLDKAKEPH